jgi:hypothetical protein
MTDGAVFQSGKYGVSPISLVNRAIPRSVNARLKNSVTSSLQDKVLTTVPSLYAFKYHGTLTILIRSSPPSRSSAVNI